MQAVSRFTGSLVSSWRRFSGTRRGHSTQYQPPRIGLALGGGFARGIAHAGLLEVLEQNHIPIHCITGVSAGSIVAAAYASGVSPAEIARAGCSMRFADVGRWTLDRLGFLASERMNRFLKRLLKRYRFEEMAIPLGMIATDLCAGEKVVFRDKGDVFLPIRASCAYPGLFLPVHYEGRLLVDGAMAMEVPALLARQLGATHVISSFLPTPVAARPPRHVFEVVNRCFQIMHQRTEDDWREASNLVVEPDVGAIQWDGFGCGEELVKAGAEAARAALPKIRSWMNPAREPHKVPGQLPPPGQAKPGLTPGSIPA